MGFLIRLEDERGESIDQIIDENSILHSYLPSNDPESNHVLAIIDDYGDTVFNRLQMSKFLVEWEKLLICVRSPDEHEILSKVHKLALRCQRKVHLFLRFIGD